MATYRVQSDSLQAIADAIRAKAGTSGSLAFPDGFADAIAAIETGGTSGGGTSGSALLVDEAVVVPAVMDTHFPAYENLKLLGDIVTGSRYVVLFLPANVPAINQNTTQGVIAAKNYFEYDFSYMVGSNGGHAQFDRGVDLAIIFKGAVQIGPYASSLPIAPGTYRLVVFV